MNEPKEIRCHAMSLSSRDITIAHYRLRWWRLVIEMPDGQGGYDMVFQKNPGTSKFRSKAILKEIEEER